MAIYSDMNGFPESGMPTLKNNKGRAKADSLVVTDAISIVAGDANNLGSVGKNNTFTNGSAGSNSFMAGNSNTINLTGTATEAVVVGVSNVGTLATSTSRLSIFGTNNTASGNAASAIGNSNLVSAPSASAFGNNNSISVGAGGAVAIGVSHSITGSSTFAFADGVSNTITGTQGLAIGSQNTSGTFGNCIGIYNTSSAADSIALGYFCTATGSLSFSAGSCANATAANAGIVGYAPNSFSVINSISNTLMLAYEGTNFLLDDNRITANKPVRLPSYTVAALPAGVIGDTAFCTNLLAPTYLAAVVGGGAIGAPVFHDGAGWKVG